MTKQSEHSSEMLAYTYPTTQYHSPVTLRILTREHLTFHINEEQALYLLILMLRSKSSLSCLTFQIKQSFALWKKKNHEVPYVLSSC